MKKKTSILKTGTSSLVRLMMEMTSLNSYVKVFGMLKSGIKN
jgi:hypothetical protein